MCYRWVMIAGLRELRQRASDLVRRAAAGETIIVTVSGREVAQLGPIQRERWRQWPDAVAIFAGPGDPAWAQDRDTVDPTPRDPFAA